MKAVASFPLPAALQEIRIWVFSVLRWKAEPSGLHSRAEPGNERGFKERENERFFQKNILFLLKEM